MTPTPQGPECADNPPPPRTANRLALVQAGPWSSAQASVLIECLQDHFDLYNERERRRPQPLEDFFFEQTDFTLQAFGLELQILIGHDRPRDLIGRRARTFWLFGRIGGADRFHPITRGDDMTRISQLMIAIRNAILGGNVIWTATAN